MPRSSWTRHKPEPSIAKGVPGVEAAEAPMAMDEVLTQPLVVLAIMSRLTSRMRAYPDPCGGGGWYIRFGLSPGVVHISRSGQVVWTGGTPALRRDVDAIVSQARRWLERSTLSDPS